MKASKSLMPAIILSMILSACATAQAPKGPIPPTAPLQVAPTTATAAIPGWYMNPPESDSDAIYVVGTSISRDMAMSVQKASLDAETHLANKIAGEISSMTKDYKREVGDEFTQSTEIVSNKLAAEVKIVGGVIAKKQITAEGGGFRTYVLMKYPLGGNNKLLQQYKEATRKPPTNQEKAEDELDQRVRERRPAAEPQAKATVLPVAAAPTVDTSNPFVTVTVTAAADKAEEN